MNRRKLLQTVGGASALGTITKSAIADKGQQTHEICIGAPSDRGYPYQFAVSGTLEKSAQPRQAPINPDRSDIRDPEDDIDGSGCRVHGATQGGWDCYAFSGDIIAFSVPEQWANQYTIYVDGSEQAASRLQTTQDPSTVACGSESGTTDSTDSDPRESEGQSDGWCPLDNQITIYATETGSEPITYDIAVSGQLELENGQRVSRTRGKLDPGGSLRPSVEFPYSGDLTRLDIDGMGSVRIQQENPC